MHDSVEEVPVLVVGAGPAGLVTAVTLAQHGVECLLVERRTELSGLPRATAVSTRSMELLRSWGLEPAIRAGEIEVTWQQWLCSTLASAENGWALPTGFPAREQSALVSPTAPSCVPQDHVEPVLLDHLRTLPSARVRMGMQVVGMTQDDDGVEAALRDVTTGESSVVRARYLVAADGAHSAVRRDLGIAMRGPDRLQGAATVLFRAPLWSLLGDRRYGLYGVDGGDAPGIFLPAGKDDRWLFGTIFEPDSTDPADFTARRMTELIRVGAGQLDLRPQIERIGTFDFAAQLADRYREGNAFLVGDAAHRVTPRGGTGMNTAMHDGYDLGWKLAWALQGWAADRLLDSYETERRPVAEHNVARSADPSGTARDAADELPVDIGGRIRHVWVSRGDDRVSTLDLVGTGFTVFTDRRESGWRAAAAALGRPVPVEVCAVDAVAARALGISGDGALLVRADGTPAGWWATGAHAHEALTAAVDASTCGRTIARLVSDSAAETALSA